MNEACLLNKKCLPCEGGVPALSEPAIQKLLSELKSEWTINTAGHLSKKYTFDNFVEAMDFAREITIIAESEGHHPDLHIGWGYCAVELWTHAVNGLTENDFIVAAKIEG
jgi:4a-hydroxytetrahydrobiopterin dehydratase